ncbi:hypothetical protein DFQ26_004301 [Actinomortierella ambigua]|nr:hypothetical protein DFQ26_004301 [Actinomortierella ambigua]
MRCKVCLFRIHPSRSDILNENGFAVQVKWERDMNRLSGNSVVPSNTFPTAAASSSHTQQQPPPPADISSLAATLGSSPTTEKSAGLPGLPSSDAPSSLNNRYYHDRSTTLVSNQADHSDACVIELTDYESFWSGRLTRQDWESQRNPAFEASLYEKWTRAAFSGVKHVDGYKVALTVTWTVSKQEGTGEKRNLLGSITLAPSVGDRRQLWADWTLNSVNERDRFQLQLTSLQKRADNLEQLAMTSQAMLVSMRQEKVDDKSDLLEKVRALINSKKAKIKSLVNRNKRLESELEALKGQMALQIKPQVEVDVKPDKGKRRGRTPAPKGVTDKTPAASQESAAASDPGFTSTIPRTQRLTTGKRGRRTNTSIMPSPESDPISSDPVVPDMIGTFQDLPSDPPSDPLDASYHPSASASDPLSAVSGSSHLTSSSHLSLMERVSQAVSQPRSKPRTQHPAEVSKDMDLYTDDDDDYSPTTNTETFRKRVKNEHGNPQTAKSYGTLAGASGASVQVVDSSSHSVEKFKRGAMKSHGLVKIKQEEPAPPASPSNIHTSSDVGSPASGHSDLQPKKTSQAAKSSDPQRGTTPMPTVPTSSNILSSTRRLPGIGKKMLTTGANTSTRLRALEKHKASQQQAQSGNGNDGQRQQGDTTTSTFSDHSGAYSPDHSMDQSRILVLSAASSPNATSVGRSDSHGGSAVLSGTKRGSGTRSPADAKRTRPNAILPDSLLLPDTDELFRRLQ